MGAILMEVLTAIRGSQEAGDSDSRAMDVHREAAKLLTRMAEVKASEGAVALDPNGALTLLAARFVFGEGEPLRVDQVSRLEFLLLMGRATLASEEQLAEFAREILLESLLVEVELARVLEAVPTPGHASVERARISLIANWRPPLDRAKTPEKEMDSLRNRVWDLVTKRRCLLSLRENQGSH